MVSSECWTEYILDGREGGTTYQLENFPLPCSGVRVQTVVVWLTFMSSRDESMI